jgi:non-specific serine/threonine protein kinase/serine/threonine-protein kinase
MNREQWIRLRQLFAEIQTTSEAERRAFLDREVGDDEELRAELQRLIAANASAQEFLSPASGKRHGSIGPYRLLDILGEGGFGVVYLAEQMRPIRRRVALKLIKPGMDTKQVIARFEAERQALALMDHPCIAQVHEAGETETGHPYFAMEYVEGVPITIFCDRERLRIPERLELFLQVCDAIQHAHQKGVIHRDIKPSNVLVAMRDGSPSPKLIDFGIVKATMAAAETIYGSTLMTREGVIIGTLGYMSPEQASSAATVDTRSDIYSLGALLYELLAGIPPFDAQRLRQAGLTDAVRIIREEDPPTLTARLEQSSEQEMAQIAEQRSADPRRLARELKGELQWITLRAMEKDPNRRYASAAELAADIRRHLAHEPVLAGAPSTMYRLGKFARRHRVGVTAAAFAFTGIVVGGIAAGIGLGRAVRAERATRREAESAQQVSAFLVDLFQSSTPDRSGGETITARTLLEQGRRQIQTESTGDPQIRARLLRTIGDAHMGLGLYDEGLQLLDEALATSENVQPRDELEVADQLRAVAHGLMVAGKPDSSSALLERAISLLEKHGAPPSAVAECLSDQATLRLNEGDLVSADSLVTLAIRMTESESEPDKDLLLEEADTKAMIAHRRYEMKEAEENYLRVLDLAEQTRKPSRAVSAHRGLAWLYAAMDEYEKAKQHGEEGVRLARKLYGPDHPRLAVALGGLAEAHFKGGDTEQAILAREEAASIFRRKNVADRLAHELNSLGLAYRYNGQFDLAIARLEEAIQIRNRIYGSENARTAETLANLARCYAQAGMAHRSDSCYQAALPVLERLNPNSAFTAWANMGYANLCRDERRIAKADQAYTHAEAMLDSTNAGMRQYRGECLIDHGYLRSLQSRHDEAESMFQSGFAMLFGENPEESAELGQAYVLRAAAQVNAGNTKVAIDHLRRAAECGVTAADVAKYSELASLRSRPDYPLVSSP